MTSVLSKDTKPVPASPASRLHTAFVGDQLLLAGPLIEVALAVKNASDVRAASAPGLSGSILTFNDADGQVVDLDLRGSNADIVARFVAMTDVSGSDDAAPAAASKGRGRPKLGVVAREVTLLPRHWEWLATQRGGASAALRRLVDEARKASDDTPDGAKTETAYRFMSAIAGDFPNYEEATRALFAGDLVRLASLTENWSADIRNYLFKRLG